MPMVSAARRASWMSAPGQQAAGRRAPAAAAATVDVPPCPAGAGPTRGRTLIVELHGDADDVVALALKKRGDNRGIDAARHRDDDAGRRWVTRQIETVRHGQRLQGKGRAQL